MKREKKSQYYLSYTFLFISITLVMVAVFRLSGKSFVWSKDGLSQHYPTLVYIHDYLRELCGNLLHGIWEIPMMDFSLGEGMDVLTTLNYYGFGDPLTLTALVCPREHLEILYGILIFIRLYLSGVFFSTFCFVKNHRKRGSVLAGALIYTFCGYALYASVRHPFFINGMVYLPLYLIGIEQIRQKGRYGLFSVVVALSLISNFYFGYMNTILAVIYVLFYMIPEKSLRWKQKWGELFKMAGAYLCGVALSGAIMVPMIMAFLGCSRGGEGGYSESLLFYPKEFYLRFLGAYAIPTSSIGEWTNLGFSVFCPVCVVLLFASKVKDKEQKAINFRLKIAFVLLTVMMLIPLVGKIMNGFGYVSNRWNYAYAMLNAYIVVRMLPSLLCRISERFRMNYRRLNSLVCILVVFNLMVNVVITYSNHFNYYLGEFEEAGMVDFNSTDSPVQAIPVAEEAEEPFYRVEQPWNISNQSLSMGYYGHSWYFSIAPAYYFDYYSSFLLNSMERTYSLRGLDGRTVLNELTANRYYTTDRENDGLIPYGYTLADTVPSENGEVNYLYENQKFLPLGYTTAAWIKESDYGRLSPIEKQQALMQSVLLEDEAGEELSLTPTQAANLNLDVSQEFCKVVSCSGITWENNRLSVKQKNATIELSFQGKENCETYLWFNKFQVIQCETQYQTGTVESGSTWNRFVLMSPSKSAWYDAPDQTINLGYSKKARTKCIITFPEKGVYSLDNCMVLYEPMDNYDSQVEVLRNDALQNLKVETNRITGTIQLSKTKLLQMAVPYSQGWTAYVDGEKKKIYRSNSMYMALELSEGSHEIEFRYATPYLKVGLLVSAGGIAILILMTGLFSRRKKTDKED